MLIVFLVTFLVPGVIVVKYGLVLSLPAGAPLSSAGPEGAQTLCHWVFDRSTAGAVTENVTS